MIVCEECIFKPFKQFQPERKKGKWIESQLLPKGMGRLFICSECNKGWAKKDRSMDGINFCPNCGASMRGDKE